MALFSLSASSAGGGDCGGGESSGGGHGSRRGTIAAAAQHHHWTLEVPGGGHGRRRSSGQLSAISAASSASHRRQQQHQQQHRHKQQHHHQQQQQQQQQLLTMPGKAVVPLIRHEPSTPPPPPAAIDTARMEKMFSVRGGQQQQQQQQEDSLAEALHDAERFLSADRVYHQVPGTHRRWEPKSDHASSRWQENLPLTRDPDDDAHTIITQTDAEDPDEPTTLKGKIRKFVKILVPHVILISMLLGYLSFGAVVLTHMESGLETDKRRQKMGKLIIMYDEIANETWRIQQLNGINHTDWSQTLKHYFLELASVHEGPRFRHQFRLYPDIDSKWTFPTALLYALTVLTTCGYGEVGVYTAGGQLFAVAFALVGIPLMFITAADIGKFLSESLMKALDLSKTCISRVRSLLRRGTGGGGGGGTGSKQRSGQDEEADDIEDEDDDEFFDHPPQALEKLWFPIITYLSVISGYCAIGAVMFRTWEPEWKFIHAFHFGFNLIVTVGLGEIVVTDGLFLCLIVAFVIVGLSVVTMCVDLASTHLKAYFTQLHYFGRAKKFLDMGDDIRNMMEYLAWMRKKKGGQVTWQDVRDLMESIRLGPYNPREAAKWRWIDETSSALSTFRLGALGPGGNGPPPGAPNGLDRNASYLMDYHRPTMRRSGGGRYSQASGLTPNRYRTAHGSLSKGSRELSPFTEDSLRDFLPNGGGGGGPGGRSSVNGGGPPRHATDLRQPHHDDKSYIDDDDDEEEEDDEQRFES